MVVDGAAGRGRCSRRGRRVAGRAREHAVRRHVDDRARPTARALAERARTSAGHAFVDAPGHRLLAQGRDRHADDHVRRRRRGHRARPAAVRGDGREDRRTPARRARARRSRCISQGVTAVNCATLAQALARRRAQAGVDLDALLEVMDGGSSDSTMRELKGQPMLEHDFTPLFKLEHMLKDVQLCLEEARAAGRRVPVRRRSPASSTARASGAAWASRTSRRCSRSSRASTGTRCSDWRVGAHADTVASRKTCEFAGNFEIPRALCIVCDVPDAGVSRSQSRAGSRRRSSVRECRRSLQLSLSPTFLCQSLSRNGPSPCALSPRASSSLTLRKGGIREPDKHFALEHDRFFLYPTFDHQRNDLVRESHQPELRRALEEGVWADGEPPAHALTRDGGIPQPDRVRIRAWAEVAARVDGHRPPRRRRAVAVLRLDARLRREAPGVEAPPPAARAAAAHVPHPAPGHGARARRLRRMPLVAGDHPRPARSRARPVLSDEEFERASEEIAAIAAGRRRARVRLATWRLTLAFRGTRGMRHAAVASRSRRSRSVS